MKLVDTLLLAASAAFLIIGVYEVISRGLTYAYWSLMLAIIFFFWFSYRKRR